MVNSRNGARKIQRNMGNVVQKVRKLVKNKKNKSMSKGHKRRLEDLPVAKVGTI